MKEQLTFRGYFVNCYMMCCGNEIKSDFEEGMLENPEGSLLQVNH